MARMQSMQSHCCFCAGSVFSALFGIIMAATGICLILNYRIMEVDTGGLPPEWQNEEGKKIVGIILMCCGFGSMGISALITVLSFTVCTKPKVTVTPSAQKVVQANVTNSKSVAIPREKHHDPYASDVTQRLPGSRGSNSRHGKRSRHKHGHLKLFKNNLAPHLEDIEGIVRPARADTIDSTMSTDSSQTESTSMTISSYSDLPGSRRVPEIRVDSSCNADHTHDYQLRETADIMPPVVCNDECFKLTDCVTPSVFTIRQLDTSSVIHNPIELPALAHNSYPHPSAKSMSGAVEDDDGLSQIEEVKRLDKNIADHIV